MSDSVPLLQQFVHDPDTAEILELKDELKRKLYSAIERREDTIKCLNELVEAINVSCYRAQASKTAGNTVAIVGGTTCVIAAILIPFTAGFSAFALIPGGILGGAGGVITAGAEFGHMAVAKIKKNAAQKQLEQEKERLKEIQALGERINSRMRHLVEKYPAINPNAIKSYVLMSGKCVLQGPKLLYKGYKLVDAGVDIGRAIFRAYRIVQPFTGALGPILFALDVIALPIDVAFMARAAHQVHRYRKGNVISGTARKLKEAVNTLIETKSDLQEQLESLDYSDDDEN